LPLTAEPNDVRRLFGLKLETGEGGLLDSLSAFDGEGGDWASAASSIVRLADAGIREARASDRGGRAIGAMKRSRRARARRAMTWGVDLWRQRVRPRGREKRDRFAMHA